MVDHILRLLRRCRRQRHTAAFPDAAGHDGMAIGNRDGPNSSDGTASDCGSVLPQQQQQQGRRQGSQRLAPGCLLTAVRDGLVLQLPWLVAAASEALTTCFGEFATSLATSRLPVFVWDCLTSDIESMDYRVGLPVWGEKDNCYGVTQKKKPPASHRCGMSRMPWPN